MQDVTQMKTTAPPISGAKAVDIESYFAIQQFLFFEAGLLDRRDYVNWLTLLTDDVSYRVLAYVNRDADVGPLAYALIDEPASRLNAKLTHAENPPTLTRRFISNIVAAAGEGAGECVVSSNLLVYRTRPGLSEGAIYAGQRTDILRHMEGGWRIARREVRLDQSVLQGSISTLF